MFSVKMFRMNGLLSPVSVEAKASVAAADVTGSAGAVSHLDE